MGFRENFGLPPNTPTEEPQEPRFVHGGKISFNEVAEALISGGANIDDVVTLAQRKNGKGYNGSIFGSVETALLDIEFGTEVRTDTDKDKVGALRKQLNARRASLGLS